MRRFALLTVTLLASLAASTAVFAQAKKGGPTGPGPKSQAEVTAVNAMIQAQTPDDKIKAVEELITKFANTDYKSYALEQEAEAYQQKGDNTKAMVYAEQALQADPKNFDADNLLANVIAATTRDTDLDKEEKLTRAEKYAHDALDLLKADAKPALQSNLNDEQWKMRKGAAESLSWQALGTIALVRKKNDEAVADFQKGVDAYPDPVLMIRAGRALLAAKRPDDAITWFEKVMNSADAPAQIKSIAQADRVRALQAKGTVPPPAK